MKVPSEMDPFLKKGFHWSSVLAGVPNNKELVDLVRTSISRTQVREMTRHSSSTSGNCFFKLIVERHILSGKMHDHCYEVSFEPRSAELKFETKGNTFLVLQVIDS